MRANQKRTIQLLGFFAVLLLLAFFLLKEDKKTIEGIKFYDDISNINKFTIENSFGKFEFNKKDDTWYMVSPDNYKANQQEINKIVDEYKGKELIDVISDKKEDFKKFTFNNQEKSITFNGKTFYVGKFTKDYLTTYVRYNDKIYLVDGAIGYNLRFNKEYYKDKQVLDFKKANLTGLEILSKNKIKLEKIDNSWYNDIGEKFPNGEKLVDDLANLKLENFIESKSFDNSPDVEIILKYNSGKRDNIKLFKEGDKIYGKSTYNDIVFTISEAQLKTLNSYFEK